LPLANRFYGFASFDRTAHRSTGEPYIVCTSNRFSQRRKFAGAHEIYEPALAGGGSETGTVGSAAIVFGTASCFIAKNAGPRRIQNFKRRAANEEEDAPLQLYLRRLGRSR